MMNHLTSMKIDENRLGKLGICPYIYVFYAQRLLDGVLNHFAERGWGTTTFLCSRWGMKVSLNVLNYPPPWIQNDRSFDMKVLMKIS